MGKDRQVCKTVWWVIATQKIVYKAIVVLMRKRDVGLAYSTALMFGYFFVPHKQTQIQPQNRVYQLCVCDFIILVIEQSSCYMPFNLCCPSCLNLPSFLLLDQSSVTQLYSKMLIQFRTQRTSVGIGTQRAGVWTQTSHAKVFAFGEDQMWTKKCDKCDIEPNMGCIKQLNYLPLGIGGKFYQCCCCMLSISPC